MKGMKFNMIIDFPSHGTAKHDNSTNKDIPDYIWVSQIFKREYKDKNGKPRYEEHIVMGKKYSNTGLFLISPLSDFFSHAGNELSSQRAYSTVIVPFMNYLRKNNIDIQDLTIDDGVDYLDGCDVCKNSKDKYMNTLQKFYMFLKEQGIIDFDDVCPLFAGKCQSQPRNNPKPPLHEIKPSYLQYYISTAIEKSPDIALGIFLQCFGGLRASEIVSIEYKDLSFVYDKDDNIIAMSIHLERKDLRLDLKTAYIAKVKCPRDQAVIPALGNLLECLLIRQKELYKSKTNDALFVDANGNPMTYMSYYNKFKRFKRCFIENLKNSPNPNLKSYAITLLTEKWGPHINRGIFSNLIAKSTNNIASIAKWRGDKSLKSALVYLNNHDQIAEDVKAYVQIATNNSLNKEADLYG
jgi:site-specific recombinase XerD